MDVKPLAQVQKKWGDRTAGAQPEYAANAPAAGAKWETNSLGANANFGAAVRSAGIEARQAAGIRRAGQAKFSRKVRDVGVSRFGPGATAAVPDYAARVQPYLQTLQGIELQARRPRGDVSNNQRISQITSALHAQRLAASAAGG